MKNKIFLLLLAAICISFSYAPSAEASNKMIEKEQDSYKIEKYITQRSDILEWRFKSINGKIYKRLYNRSTNQWVGNWIPV